MNTPKHTPGPWKATVTCYPDGKLQGRPYVTSNATGQHVAELFMDSKSEADAALISAAPDLLREARNALNVLAALATGQLARVRKDSPAILGLRAAIAKAEGRQ